MKLSDIRRQTVHTQNSSIDIGAPPPPGAISLDKFSSMDSLNDVLDDLFPAAAAAAGIQHAGAGTGGMLFSGTLPDGLQPGIDASFIEDFGAGNAMA
eukprot:SAG22_NODE_11985_length_461_cov_0.569061_1_plen_97_part_00